MSKRKETKEQEETLVERARKYEKARQKYEIIHALIISIIFIGAFVCGLFIIPNLSYETGEWLVLISVMFLSASLLFFAIRDINS